MTTLNKKDINKLIKHNIYLRGQQTRVANENSEFIEQLFKDIVFYISQNDKIDLDEINNIIDKKFNELIEDIYTQTEKINEHESNFMSKFLVGAGLVASFSNPKKINLDLHNIIQDKKIKELINKQKKHIKKEIQKSIKKNVFDFKKINKEELFNVITKNKNNLTEKNIRYIKALSKTITTKTINEQASRIYKKNGISQYQYVAVLDNRTTIICSSLHSRIFNFSYSSAPKPPQHIGCRSIILPITDNSPIIKEQTFEDFLKNKEEKDLKQIFGKKRLELLKQKQITIKELIDDKENIIPLSELIEKENGK